jgi:F-type H+-transporting ATPase subunit epsilon|tara:strand:+ start:282 stop:680 length:399 start_codon:yes stop_codon:yes gene_type:complete
MSEEFKVEIVNPEKSFLSEENVTEVVIPAFEGEMGILKDHISIISFLKPGIIKVYSKSEEKKYFVEDGIVEFKDNNLSILTSSIFKVSDLDRNKIDQIVKDAEKETAVDNIDDQKKYLIDQKIEVLKNLNLN